VSRDEAKKLLGGYATDSLTGEERKALLAAALDDQELFDALQQEQALKDVLDDRVARAEIRQALDMRQPQADAWWTRWWAWGGAGAAVAAALAILIILPRGTQQPAATPVEIARVEKEAAEAPAATLKTLAESKAPSPPKRASTPVREKLSAVSAPAGSAGALARDTKQEPAPPVNLVGQTATVQVQAQADVLKEEPSTQLQQAPKQVQQAPGAGQAAGKDAAISLNSARDNRQQAALAAAPTAAPAANPAVLAAKKARASPLWNFSLLRRDARGDYIPATAAAIAEFDAVRVNVTPPAEGMLQLFVIHSGQSSPGGPARAVKPHLAYTVPDAPVIVKPGDVLELVLTGIDGQVRTSIVLGKP
jgi:hypothetical protein